MHSENKTLIREIHADAHAPFAMTSPATALRLFFDVVLSVVVTLLAGVLIYEAIKDLHLSTQATVLFNLFAMGIGVAFLVYRNADAIPVLDFLKLRNFRFSDILLGAIAGFFLLSFGSVVAQALSGAGFELNKSDTTASLVTPPSAVAIVLAFIGPGLLIPVIEELWVRGAMTSTLERMSHLGKYAHGITLFFIPAIISATLFSLLHYQGASSASDYYVLFITFASGMLFSALTYVRGCIYPAIFTHAVNNCLVLSVGFFL